MPNQQIFGVRERPGARWQRRTNLWRKVTSPRTCSTELMNGDRADKGNRAQQQGEALIAHLPRSARLETQLKPFLCPEETIVTPTCAHQLN